MPGIRLVLPVVCFGLLAGCTHANTAGSSNVSKVVAPAFPDSGAQSGDQQSRSLAPPSSGTAIGQQATQIRGGVDRLRGDLDQKQRSVGELTAERTSRATDYFTRIATINAKLQAGTTAGNPLLLAEWRQARADLTALEGLVGRLSEISAGLTDDTAVGLYLSNQVRSTLALPGALDEDHVELNRLYADITVLQLQVSQVLGDTLNEINRQNEILAVEYRNIAITSRAIEVGQILGNNLGSVAPPLPPVGPFAAPTNAVTVQAGTPEPSQLMIRRKPRRHHRSPARARPPSARKTAPALTSSRTVVPTVNQRDQPLLVISGDPQDTAYEDRLYTAVSTQLEKNPDARFNVRAVALAQNSAARWAIQAVELEQKANAVARSLTAYGLPRSRISISQGSQAGLQSGEIRIYVQ